MASIAEAWGERIQTAGSSSGRGEETSDASRHSRKDYLRFYLYVLAKENGELEGDSQDAHELAIQREQECMIIPLHSIHPSARPPWLKPDALPLLVQVKEDGNYLHPGKLAVEFLRTLNHQEPLGINTGRGIGGASLASFVATSISEDKYKDKGRFSDDDVNAYREAREHQTHDLQAKVPRTHGLKTLPPIATAQDEKKRGSARGSYASLDEQMRLRQTGGRSKQAMAAAIAQGVM